MRPIKPSKASVWLVRFEDTDSMRLVVCPIDTPIEKVHKRVMAMPGVAICKFDKFTITRIDAGEFEIIALIEMATLDDRQYNQEKKVAGRFRRFKKRKKRRTRDGE